MDTMHKKGVNMALKIIYGKSGSGKSEYCYKQIANDIEKGKNIFLITPEQFSYNAEKRLMEVIDKKAITQAEVLHLSRMAKRVIKELGISGKRITKTGKAMLISDILTKNKKELTYLSKSEENIELAISCITEFKKHGITMQMLKQQIEKTENIYLKTKLEDIYIIYEKYNDKISKAYIDEADELTILAQNVEKIEWLKNSIIYIDEFAGFTVPEYNVIQELMKYCEQINITITSDALEEAKKTDTDVFYENKITIKKLVRIAKENSIDIEKPIYLEKPLRFQNEELKHIEAQIFQTNPIKWEQTVENTHIFLAKNQYTEIENTAIKITKLIKEKGLRYRDIAIITKNIQNYSNLTKVIFDKYDIPIFIDEKRELNQNVIIQYILSILDILRKNYSKESIFQYIKMGFTNIEQEDIFKLENYCTKWGIKQNKFKSDFTYEMKDKKEQVSYLNELRKQIIEPLEDLKQTVKQQRTAKGITIALYDFLQKQDIEKQIIKKINYLTEIGRIELAQEYKESYEIIINLFDEIIDIFGTDAINIEQYENLLRQGLKTSELAKIPATQDQVIMGDVDRSRSHKVEAVFIIGLNDGVYPNVNKSEGFLGDEERNELKAHGIELAKGTLENLYDDNFNIYKAFTTAQKEIYLSYSSSNTDGTALRPSVYITKIKKIFPKLQEQSDVIQNNYNITNQKATYEILIEKLAKAQKTGELEIKWKEVYQYFKNQNEWKQKLEKDIQAINYTNLPKNIHIETIKKLYGNQLTTSVSRLEKYKSCPFSYFLQYGLNLKQKEELKIQSFDTGSFMHEVIDMFFEQVKEQNQDLPNLLVQEQDIQKIVKDIIETKLNYEKYKFTATVKYKILIQRLERMITKALKYIIESLVYSDFNIEGTEIEFGKGKEYKPIVLDLENGKKIEITGKIDRIDIAKTKEGNYLRIIDYKSSAKNVDLNEVYAGLQIQLLTYLDAICQEKDLLPAGILYFGLIEQMISANKNITEEQIEEEIRKNFKMKGLILADIKVVKMQDKNLENGTSKIIPAGITTSGAINKRDTNGINKEEFEILQKYIGNVIKQIGKEILQGKIELKPYNHKGKTPCKYCEYHAICGFDAKNNSNKYQYIGNLTKDEVIQKMKEEDI